MENVLSCPHTALLYTHPILLWNTVPLKMKYSVMTGCDFIPMNHLSVMVAVPLGTPFKAMDHSYIKQPYSLIAVENFFKTNIKISLFNPCFRFLFSKLKESLSYNKSSTFHEMALQQLHTILPAIRPLHGIYRIWPNSYTFQQGICKNCIKKNSVHRVWKTLLNTASC